MNLKIGSLFLVAITTSNAFVNYENYKIYKIISESEEQVYILNDLREDGHYGFSTDTINVGKHAKIMVQPSEHEEFEKYISSIGMKPELSLSNVQELILAQMQPVITSRINTLGSFDRNQYHTLDQIHNWLGELQELYSGIVRTVTAAKSHEGREIKRIIINFRAENRRLNPLIGMVEGGIYGREWISLATVTWIIKEFLKSNDADIRYMAEAVIWHIYSVMNPDTYMYSFSNNHMWIKDPSPLYNTTCVDKEDDLSEGVDLNRNFKFVWISTIASTDPCSQSFTGPSVSEPEAKAIMNYAQNEKRSGRVINYFAFYSNSQTTLTPFSHQFGYEVLEVPKYGDRYEIAIRGREKQKVKYGRHYEVGTPANISYEVSDASFDWVKGDANVPIVNSFELRDVGEYDFLLPPEQIIPNNEEIMARSVEINIATKELRHYSGTSSAYRSLIFLAVNALLLIVVQ